MTMEAHREPTRWASGLRTAFLFVAVSLLAGAASAQDWDKLQPKTPPIQGGEVELPPPPVQAQGDNAKVLVQALKGLVFVTGPEKVNKAGLSGIEGIRAEGLEILQTPEFRARMEAFLGKPVTMLSLNTLVRDVVIYYREHDRPVVDVIVPEQEITSGVIQLIVLEGRLGQVRVENNKWFDGKFLADQVRLRPGEPFREEKLLADLDWINNNPFREVNFIYTPGSQVGTADLLLRTNDRLPVRFFMGYEDSGTDLTGDERLFTGFNYGDVFGLDHQMNYQFTGDADFDKLVAHSGSYIIPLPWRHTFTLFGSYVQSRADLPAPFNLEGFSWQSSARYLIPLPQFGDYKHEFQTGFDFKQSNNNLEFGGALVTNSLTDVDQFVFGYTGNFKDPWGFTTFGGTLFYNPGELTDNDNDSDYQAIRAFADSDYLYGKLEAQRSTRLPWDFSLITRGVVQLSNANLLGSEQFGLGGYSTVRGYDEREANGDEGYLVSIELRTPPLTLIRDTKDQLQFLFFWDYGQVSNRILLPGEDPHTLLSSIGPGVRYAFNPYVSFRFDYGFQLYQAVATRHNGRGHLGVVVAY